MHTIFPICDELKSKSGITVTVNGDTLGLYDASVLYPPFKFLKYAPYGIFDFEGEAEITVTVPFELTQVDIRPKSKKIDFTHDAHNVRFTLKEPAKLSVEFNGSIDNALALFAYAPETEIPDPADENVLYFGPGIHTPGDLEIKSGTTVYLAGGAYVYGSFYTEKGAENVRILGRGVLDGRDHARPAPHKLVEPYYARKFLLQDITMHNAPSWTVRVFGCDDVIVRNSNIFGYRGNSDGVDVCGSRNVEVYGMFIRNWDDALAVKAFETGDMDNVYFHDCTIWNDFARPIEVGYEHRADEIKNIHYKDIDIIHSMSGYPLIGIHQGDRAHIHDVLFEDIRVEDALGGQFIDLRIKPSGWNRDGKPGYIERVAFKNIYLNGKPGLDKLPEPSRIEGWSEESSISDVTFENVFISGKRITNEKECGLQLLQHCHNVRFITPENAGGERPVQVQTRVEILEKKPLSNGLYAVSARVILTNTDKERTAEGSLWLEAYPKTECTGLPVDWRYGLKPGEEAVKELAFTLRAGKYFITTQSSMIDVIPDFVLLELPMPVHALEKEADFAAVIENEAADIFTMEGRKIGSLALAHLGERLYLGGHITDLAVRDGELPPENPDLRYFCLNMPVRESKLDLYAARLPGYAEGEVMFLIPETGFGETTALQMGKDGPVRAPELRNVAELTYVFKNMPKVESVAHLTFDPNEDGPLTFQKAGDGYDFAGSVPLTELGITEKSGEYVLEFSVNAVADGTAHFDRVPMFHSLDPKACVQMYGRLKFE